MKSLIKFCLVGCLLLVSDRAIAKPRKQKMCMYPVEEHSMTYKVYVYKKFGISMEMPDNLVSMLLQDGSIDIIDRGTYKLLQCPVKKRLGRGAHGTMIKWADNTAYSNSINIKENVDLYIQKQYSNTYLIILRLVNKKGQLIDIQMYDEGPIYDHLAELYIKQYIKLGRTIKFLD